MKSGETGRPLQELVLPTEAAGDLDVAEPSLAAAVPQNPAPKLARLWYRWIIVSRGSNRPKGRWQ